MILLDTCTLIWALFNSDRLSQAAKTAIRGNRRAVSIASLWEISIKVNLGKLELTKTITQIAAMCENVSIELLPITPVACEALRQLPMIHRDPFDRMIIAQTLVGGMPVVTDDGKIWQYDQVVKIW